MPCLPSLTVMTNTASTKPIFLDYHSTTPVDERVAAVALNFMVNDFGNASSTQHVFGDTAKLAVENARRQLASLVGAANPKVVFTSGATEAINIVLQNFARTKAGNHKPKIAMLAVEHSAVVNTVKKLEQLNLVQAIILPVDSMGRIDKSEAESIIRSGVDLVCAMMANNEIGNIYPIAFLAQICDETNTPILCDASQAAGKVPIEFDLWNLTYLVVSAHKMYGPKGVGALVCQRSNLPSAITFGGEQEFGVRPGTINVPGIAAFGEACRLRQIEMVIDEEDIGRKRNTLLASLKKEIDGITVNGDQSNRLAGNLHISIENVPNDALVARVRNLVALSTGSACTSGVEAPSHVLEAMKLDQEKIDSAIRIGLGKFTTNEEISQTISILKQQIDQIRKLVDSQSSSNTFTRV